MSSYSTLKAEIRQAGIDNAAEILALCPHLKIANRPNPVITAPETRLTHVSLCSSIFSRKAPTVMLKMSHHRDEPMKTPETRAQADMLLAGSLARSQLAKNAAKENIVIGFMSVRNNVET